MIRPFFNTAFVFLIWVSGLAVAKAQLMEPMNAPPEAEPRVLDWNRTFPVTPLFSEWTNALSLGKDGQSTGEIFLHGRSLAWISGQNLSLPTTSNGPFLLADFIHFDNGADGGRPVYRRLLSVLSCDASRTYYIKAYADIVIGPDAVIRAQSDVIEPISYSVDRPFAGGANTFDTLCFNEEVHRLFLASS